MTGMLIEIFDLDGVLFINLSYFYEFIIKDKMIWAMKGLDLWRFWNSSLSYDHKSDV